MPKPEKHIIFIIGILIVLLFAPNVTNAQNNNSQLAFEYFRNNEFEKAAVIFLELYEARNNTYYRTYYIQSLVKSDQFDEAEKFVKRAIRKNSNDVELQIEQAYIYELQGDEEKAEKAYRDIIETETVTPNSVKSLANNFIRKRKYELAEQTYLTGQKHISNQDFYYELANLYAMQRKYDKMIEAYMDLLGTNASYLNKVQTRLQSLAMHDIDDSMNPIIESTLIGRIQKNASNPVYTEMLIWQYVQTGKYQQAIQHANALDKRFNEKGKRLYKLGQLASNNEKHKIAKQCFELVYEYGKVSPYYFNAKLIELNYLYNEATQSINPNQNALNELETLISTTADEAPRKLKYPLIKLLAQVQAFYLNKPEEALAKIDSISEQLRLPQEDQAELSMLKGDIYLLNENPWDATLVYAKVEQENKENPIGSEAKFRKAKLAYYTGQFEWAKAQLDVLKASTSKLIANDAMELSLLISENSSEDSLQSALMQFARADLYQFKRKYGESLVVLDSVLADYPTNELIDDVLYRKGLINERLGNYEDAIDFYNQVVTNHSWGILADNALIRIGRIYHHKLNDSEAAIQTYTQFLLQHKSSIFISEARNSLRTLRGDFDDKTPTDEITD
ncbi:MAG: tetratricopeptide repeat protein [Bacteroidales bacterium]|jgi:tetratricopeptide (TPR) repeat protein|nr:tetratricopeptide repeat protein [Bacteroidales bacterium]